MKKKILVVLSACIFIIALTLSFNFVQGNNDGTSLEGVTIMAEAYAHHPCEGWDGTPYWGWDDVEWMDCIIIQWCVPPCV